MKKKLYIALIFTVIAIFFAIGFYGYNYYLTSIEERFFNPLHNQLKPSGFIGHGLGIIGTGMMFIGVSVYMLMKRVPFLSRIGATTYWLDFHIILCSIGPILVLYHTAFKFGGIVAVSFWCMVAVFLSGIAGRFIYTQIPRSIKGKEYSLDELNSLNQSYTEELKKYGEFDESLIAKIEHFASLKVYKETTLFSMLHLIHKDHSANKKMLKSLKKELRERKIQRKTIRTILNLCKSKLILSRRINLLHSFRAMFRHWHVVHLPFAIIMLIIVIVHITITVALGYRWIF